MISVHARNFLFPKNEEVGPGNLLATQLHQSAFLWTKKKKRFHKSLPYTYILRTVFNMFKNSHKKVIVKSSRKAE